MKINEQEKVDKCVEKMAHSLKTIADQVNTSVISRLARIWENVGRKHI